MEGQPGKAEDIIDLLKDCGTVPQALIERIHAERDLSILKRWRKSAAKASSIEEFLADMQAE